MTNLQQPELLQNNSDSLNDHSWEMHSIGDVIPKNTNILDDDDVTTTYPIPASIMIPNGDGVLVPAMQDVIWKGRNIKVYVRDYRHVPLVKLQIATSLLLFIVFGINDQTTGAMMPTLQERYNISSAGVSNIFLFQLGGYAFASLINEYIHRKVGVRGVITFSSLTFAIFYGLMLMEPPNFFLYLIYGLPIGLSIGLVDCTCSVVFGTLTVNKNVWMGFLHGTYGVASMATPPLAAHYAESDHWNRYFLLPFLGSILGLILSFPAFKYDDQYKYDYECSQDDLEHSSSSTSIGTTITENKSDNNNSEFQIDSQFDNNTSTLHTSNNLSGLALLKNPIVLLHATYLFFFLGAELATGAFLLSFLLEKCPNRVGMSYISSSYWAGITVGRFLLGHITDRYFENVYKATKFYIKVTLIGYLIFCIISMISPNDPTNSSSPYFITFFLVTFISGIFVGPLFPNGSIVALQLLPKKYHVGGLGIAVAGGGIGCAFLPYMVGIITNFTGLWLYPFLSALMMIVVAISWNLYPKYIQGHEEFL